MESELNCAVCGNEYRNDNLPRLLTACGHTYCESCLDTMMTEEEDGTHHVICPEDNTVTHLDSNDVSQFPKNIALLKVIEGKKSQIGFKEDSFDFTKIQRREDSRGDQTEQDILNQFQCGKQFSSSHEENSTKEETGILETAAPKKEEFELCLPHQKPMEIVCLEDMIRICAKCAIFGEHKGHEFKSIEQIEEEWDCFREDIVNLYGRKENLEKAIYNQQNATSIWGIFEQSKKKHQKDLADRFKKLKEAVKKAEDEAVKKLQELSSQAEGKIKAILKMDPSIESEYKNWQDKSFGLILKTQECSLQDKLKNLCDYHNTRLVPQGEAILDKMKELQNQIPTKVQNILKSISIDCNEEVLFSVDNYIKISESSSLNKKQEIQPQNNVKLKSPTSYEESLLQSEVNEAKQEPIYIHPVQPFEQSVAYYPQMDLTSNSFSTVGQPYSSPNTKMRETVMREESPGEGIFIQKVERPTKKKLKMIKVPQKFEKILNDLYNDTLDLLDFTNAELGDATILQICQFLRGSKVRSVKFIRNKLTDDCISKMMAAMGCVITLNLSQNMLTERTIEFLINNRASMPNMKSVILSQNKIIERKHKVLIEKLRKLDLTVSV